MPDIDDKFLLGELKAEVRGMRRDIMDMNNEMGLLRIEVNRLTIWRAQIWAVSAVIAAAISMLAKYVDRIWP